MPPPELMQQTSPWPFMHTAGDNHQTLLTRSSHCRSGRGTGEKTVGDCLFQWCGVDQEELAAVRHRHRLSISQTWWCLPAVNGRNRYRKRSVVNGQRHWLVLIHRVLNNGPLSVLRACRQHHITQSASHVPSESTSRSAAFSPQTACLRDAYNLDVVPLHGHIGSTEV